MLGPCQKTVFNSKICIYNSVNPTDLPLESIKMNRRIFCLLAALLLLLPSVASPSSACDHYDPDTGDPYPEYQDGYVAPQPGVPGYSGDIRCSHCHAIIQPGGVIYVEEFYDCMDPPTDKPDPRINNPPAQYGDNNPPDTDPDNNPDDPDNPANPDNPDNPDNPANPENPGTPENPDNPVTPGQNNPQDPPANADTPANPENPENPSNPENPDNPADPETPAQTDPPAQQDNPETPEQPVTPEQTNPEKQESKPETPEQPVIPAQQDTKEQQTVPEEPVQPSTPAQPAQQEPENEPAQPETPVQPADSSRQDEPAKPVIPEQPVIPPQQDTPADPETPAEAVVTPPPVPGENDAAEPSVTAAPGGQQSRRSRGKKTDEPFSTQYPYRKVKMTPQKNIRAKAAGILIWPTVQTPFQQMLQ